MKSGTKVTRVARRNLLRVEISEDGGLASSLPSQNRSKMKNEKIKINKKRNRRLPFLGDSNDEKALRPRQKPRG
jgi:hypothetical protein